MFLYIFGFFTLVMLGIWLLLVLYMMIVKPKEGSSSSVFVKVLKRSGVLLLVYVIVVIVGAMIFTSQYTKECSPNKEDVKVMTPMAKAISDYIATDGIPKSLKDIPDLPYVLIGCNKSQENVEHCSFYVENSKYSLELYRLLTLYLTIENKINKTGIYYDFKKDNRQDRWDLVKEKAYSSKSTGICNPMRM